MTIMGNKWIEKEASKHSIMKQTAPSYESNPIPDFIPINSTKPIKRHTKAFNATMVKTLRGVRK
jgi:hypothetical protein